MDGGVLYRQGDNAGNPDEQMRAWMLDYAERYFSEERGPVFVLQIKIDGAGARGDLYTLEQLSEGRGYWKGVAAATEHWRERMQRPMARPYSKPKTPQP